MTKQIDEIMKSIESDYDWDDSYSLTVRRNLEKHLKPSSKKEVWGEYNFLEPVLRPETKRIIKEMESKSESTKEEVCEHEFTTTKP
jgi:hypothetical protein